MSKQTRIVPTTLIGINTAAVDGANKTITPDKNPRSAAGKEPYMIAHKAIGIKDRLMETGPIATKLPTTCKTIMIAARRATPVIF